MTKNDGAGSEDPLWRVAADHYAERLRRYLLKRLDDQEADDLMQEIYLRLLRVPRSEFIRDPEAYIFSVARSVVADFYRRTSRLGDTICTDTDKMQQVSENPECIQADEIAERATSTQYLQSILAQLPPIQAAALLMRARDGYSYAEIAARLEVSERQVERYLLNARGHFAEALRSEQGKPKGSTGKKEAS